MPVKMVIGSPGLWLGPFTDAAPEGSLRQALGVVVFGAQMLRKAPPFRQYSAGSETAFGSALSAIFGYGGRVFLSANGTIWRETGAGTALYSSLTSPFSAAVFSDDNNLRTVEASGNIYLASSNGVLKIDSTSSNPYRPGVPRGLDPTLTQSASATGFLTASGQQVGYRILFGIQDANNNYVYGPPSGRAVFTATAAANVTVKAFMHTAVQAAANATSYFYQVYRTATFTGDPGDDMQLVYQAQLTSTDVSNKYIQFTDVTPDNLRGPSLYTNASQQGIAFANEPPPIAQDIALFRSCVFYANTTQKHRATLSMLGIPDQLVVSTGAGGFTKSGGSVIVTFTGSPDLTGIPTDGTAKLSVTGATSAGNNGDGFPITAVGATTITATNAGAVTEAGLAGSRCMATKLTIAAVNYWAGYGTEVPASQIYQVTTSGTAQSNVSLTSASLVRVVNQQTTQTVVAVSISGPDDAAGRMLFEAANLGASAFTISAQGTSFSIKWAPTIPTTAVLTSQNDAVGNRLYYSKPNQPEHVPLAQYIDIGAKSKNILRAIALRDALVVFKEDGMFRVTGDGNTFSLALANGDAILLGKRAADTLQNTIYAYTRSGVAEVSEMNVRFIDQPIATHTRSVAEVAASNSSLLTGGSIYVLTSEIQQTVLVGAYLSNPFLYSRRSGGWSQIYETDPAAESNLNPWLKKPSAQIGGVRYYCEQTGKHVFRDELYSDTEAPNSLKPTVGYTSSHKYLINITAVNAGASTITATALGDQSIIVGSVVQENQSNANGYFSYYRVTAINGSIYTLARVTTTGSAEFAFTTGHAYQHVGQTSTLEWNEFTNGQDASLKAFREAAILLAPESTASAMTISTYTDLDTTARSAAAVTTTTNPSPPSMVRGLIPGTQRYGRRLSLQLSHSTPGEYLFIRGVAYTFDEVPDSAVPT